MAEPSGRDQVAEFDYALGSVASGAIEASCEAAAALLPGSTGATIAFQSDGGTLDEYETTWTTSYLLPSSDNPLALPDDPQQRLVRTTSFEPGTGTLSWGSEAMARVFGSGWPGNASEGRVEPFEATIQAQGLRSQPPTQNADTGQYFVRWDAMVTTMQGGLRGWHRLVDASEGPFTLRGNLTLYLEGAEITDPAGRAHRLPTAHSTVMVHDTPAAAHRQEMHRHATLRLTSAVVHLDAEQASLICRDVAGTIDGTFLAHHADGHLANPEQRLPFGPVDLSLVGSFAFAESVADDEAASPPPIRGRAEGRFAAVGLDYEPAEWEPNGVAVAATAGSLAALAAALGWRLYTRLRRSDLLEQGTRNLVHEAVRANPWSSLPQLQKATGFPRSTVRYQLQVLGRHGIVRTHQQAGRTVFAAAEEGLAPADPVTLTLHAQLTDGPRRLAEVMRVLVKRHDFSRFGAWKAVHRATKDHIVRLERSDREVWVRRHE